MSLGIHLPPYARFDTTLPVVVPHGFSRKEAIKVVKCDRSCFLDKFPEAELAPGPREVHLIRFSKSFELKEILGMINSEKSIKPEPLDIALVIADQHPGFRIEFGVAFLDQLWSEGKRMRTTFFPYLISSMNCRPAIHLRSGQKPLHPGWRIAVSSPLRGEPLA